MCVVVAGVEGRLSSWQWAANSRAWKIDLCMLLTATLPCCRGAGGAAAAGQTATECVCFNNKQAGSARQWKAAVLTAWCRAPIARCARLPSSWPAGGQSIDRAGVLRCSLVQHLCSQWPSFNAQHLPHLPFPTTQSHLRGPHTLAQGPCHLPTATHLASALLCGACLRHSLAEAAVGHILRSVLSAARSVHSILLGIDTHSAGEGHAR